MSCDTCGTTLTPGQRFCGGCGGIQTRECRGCGQTVSKALRFCSECGVELDAITAGLTNASARAWSDTFDAMGWFEQPAASLGPVMQKLYTPLVDEKEQLVFCTRIRDEDWRIKEFRIDGQKVEGESEKGRRWTKAAIIGASAVFFPPAALAAFAMKRSDQVWLIAFRDRFMLLNLTDEQVVQWPFASITQGWVDNKGTFKLFIDDGTVVQFVVKTRGTKLIKAWRFAGNMIDEDNRLHEYNRDMALARREDENLEFMDIVKRFLDEAASC